MQFVSLLTYTERPFIRVDLLLGHIAHCLLDLQQLGLDTDLAVLEAFAKNDLAEVLRLLIVDREEIICLRLLEGLNERIQLVLIFHLLLKERNRIEVLLVVDQRSQQLKVGKSLRGRLHLALQICGRLLAILVKLRFGWIVA